MKNNNGHGHSHAPHSHADENAGAPLPRPIEKITVTFDPNTKQLRYALEHLTYADAIQRLELAQLFMWDDLKRDQAKIDAHE